MKQGNTVYVEQVSGRDRDARENLLAGLFQQKKDLTTQERCDRTIYKIVLIHRFSTLKIAYTASVAIANTIQTSGC